LSSVVILAVGLRAFLGGECRLGVQLVGARLMFVVVAKRLVA